MKEQVLSYLHNVKKTRWIVIVVALIAVLMVSLGVHSSHSLSKVIPGHAYYVPTLNKYVAFGSGEFAGHMILVQDKETAIKALKSDDDFVKVYQTNTVNVSTDEGVGKEAYTVSDNQVSLTAVEAFHPSSDYFSGNSNTTMITGFWGAMASSLLLPAIEGDINNSINSNTLQTSNIRIDLTNTKVSGLTIHKIKCDLVIDGKSQATTLEEAK